MTFDRAIAASLTVGLLLPGASAVAADRTPGFDEQSLELPGMPAAIVPADLTGDGRDDLVVLVAYTGWDELATTEQVRFDDIEGLVEVMSVVTSLVDRRELRLYAARPDGAGFEPQPAVLELDTSVHALDTRRDARPLLAITDQGVAAVVWQREGEAHRLSLEPILAAETVLTGTGTFYSALRFLHDLDDDGRADLVLPTASGWSVHRGLETGFEETPTASLALPAETADETEADGAEEAPASATPNGAATADDEGEQREASERPPRRPSPRQPEVIDVDSDGLSDLVVLDRRRGRRPHVHLNLGDLAFAPAVAIEPPAGRDGETVVHVGDLDGDGRVSVVTAEEIEPPDEAGYKLEIEHAKEPDFVYREYPVTADLALAALPRLVLAAEGYIFEGGREDDDAEDPEGENDEDVDIELPGGFKDLDGDGRQDLVAITLDFSIVPLVFRALVLGTVSLRMDFHPHCQAPDGTFAVPAGLDLSGKFKLDLHRVQVKHLSQFAGDFDGDGRADFVQLGRGRKVTIHLGGPGCRYPVEPDRVIRLAKEPRHLGLVRILDLDGDGLSDLYVVHPGKGRKSAETPPVRLDIYLGRR